METLQPKEIRVTYATKPDAQGFDEIKITTVPRYKTSGLSGNEWRISGKCQLLRKGKVVHEFFMANVKNCANALPAEIMRAQDDMKFFFGGGEDGKCDQEGCPEIATVFYRVKNKFCNHVYKHEPIPTEGIVIRQFCERHSKRGDCAFDDSDSNYEVMKGNPKEPENKDVKPSTFGGIIKVDL